MSENLLESISLQSQSIEAIKSLLAWKKISSNPLPKHIVLSDALALVLSAKKDQYYTCSPSKCSCPSFIYRGGSCKHQRKFFPDAESLADPRGLTTGKYHEVPEECISDLFNHARAVPRMESNFIKQNYQDHLHFILNS